jgi:hypothetical protein
MMQNSGNNPRVIRLEWGNLCSLLWTDHFREGQPGDRICLWSCSFLHFYPRPKELLHNENWETILFVFGMMTVIETMNTSGFFPMAGPSQCPMGQARSTEALYQNVPEYPPALLGG